jgi:hypothetical protein
MCDECVGASLVLNKTEASADMGWTVDQTAGSITTGRAP